MTQQARCLSERNDDVGPSIVEHLRADLPAFTRDSRSKCRLIEPKLATLRVSTIVRGISPSLTREEVVGIDTLDVTHRDVLMRCVRDKQAQVEDELRSVSDGLTPFFHALRDL